MWALTLFWVSALLLAYVYAGYPVIIRAWACLRPKPCTRGITLPAVSIVVVAHNEGERVESRLLNLLALDYPRESVEIVLGSDGSTDETVARARAFGQEGIRVAAFGDRRGKAAVLNDLVPGCRGEILVLADARQRFETGALRALVAPFADPGVGAVSGELILERERAGTLVGEGAGRYWSYEKSIRIAESRVDSAVGATGAIYAIRRDLFRPIPEDTILDDVLIPMRIVRRGFRVLFEPQARAYDRPVTTARQEFTRKVRTIAGNFQLFAREPWLLHPLKNRLWLQTVSHKGLRLLGPLLLAAIFAASLLLSASPFFAAALLAQVVFYAAAVAGAVAGRAGARPSLLALPYLVCLLSWATVIAFARFVTGRQRATWDAAT